MYQHLHVIKTLNESARTCVISFYYRGERTGTFKIPEENGGFTIPNQNGGLRVRRENGHASGFGVGHFNRIKMMYI